MVANLNDFQELQSVAAGSLELLNKSEIEQQIATAHKYPRSIKTFRDQTLQLVTLSEAIAGECVYSLPRAGTTIEGPSARFAEVIVNTWGNCRCGARVISEDDQFVTAQGVFHDLQANSAITYEVRRRITNKQGKKFQPDMIAVTANAACSIALRNAALKGVPKAFWSEMYDAARQTIMGDITTLANRRKQMLDALMRYGINEDVVLRYVGAVGVEDISLENMVQLRGLGVALKDGETTLEKILAAMNDEKPVTSLDELRGKTIAQPKPKGANPAATPGPSEAEKNETASQWPEIFTDPETKETTWIDSQGVMFDSKAYQMDADTAQPKVNLDGSFRKKRSLK